MRIGEEVARNKARSLRRNMTKAEVILWLHLRALRDRGYNFRRQHPIGPYIADFALLSAKIVVEVDGETHGTADELAHNRRRDAYLRAQDWRVLRVANIDVYENVDGVVEFVLSQIPLPVRPSDEPPPPQAGEDKNASAVIPNFRSLR